VLLGWHLFAMPGLSHYQLHLFTDLTALKRHFPISHFFGDLFTFRCAKERRNCLACLRDLAFTHNDIQRIILASDEMEAKLISHLSHHASRHGQ
jgi:hypothetical protein